MKRHGAGEIAAGILLFAGFLGGVAFIYLWGDTYLSGRQLLGRENLLLMARTQIDTRALFWHLLTARGKYVLLLWLLGYTAAALPALFLSLAWLGFSAGVFISLFVIRLRLAGMLLFLAAVLPQAAVYAPLVWKLSMGVYEKGMTRFKRREVFGSWEMEKAYMRTGGVCLALLLVGLALESCVSPLILRQVVEYFF